MKAESETSLSIAYLSDNISERKISDAVFIRDLLDGIFDVKMDDDDIDKMYRLGHWEEGKARPLLVSFKKLEHKEHIMANLRNLKHPLDKFKGMSISHNLHPKEREVNKRMVEEAKQEHAANRSEDVESCRFLVVG